MCRLGPEPMVLVSVSVWQWRPWLEALVGDLVNAQESLEIGMPTHVPQLRVGRFSVLARMWMRNGWLRAQPGDGEGQQSTSSLASLVGNQRLFFITATWLRFKGSCALRGKGWAGAGDRGHFH